MAASVIVDRKTQISQACQSGEEFARIYYEKFDKQRHLISNLYEQSGNVVWNGNYVTGRENIGKFFQNLPASESDLLSLDAQPILDEFVQGQTTILVHAAGNIKFSGKNRCKFSESFLLTAKQGNDGSVWRVVSDTFRFHEPLPT
ncbi:NTF2-related export protein 1-like [Limulus polyphemus]|uniref:NTF2-related export protein n=1 Tax=Limulus polyphemus TaxID=6850 RepID=A0ABM1B2K2_LIMPO|nr:NTF2-related export protein 1-like [Limulus polyphemus]